MATKSSQLTLADAVVFDRVPEDGPIQFKSLSDFTQGDAGRLLNTFQEMQRRQVNIVEALLGHPQMSPRHKSTTNNKKKANDRDCPSPRSSPIRQGILEKLLSLGSLSPSRHKAKNSAADDAIPMTNKVIDRHV